MVERKSLIIARGREGRRVEGEKSASLRDSKAESALKEKQRSAASQWKRWRRPKRRRTDCKEAHSSLYRFQGSREHLDNCTEQEIREVAESEAMVNESTSVYHED